MRFNEQNLLIIRKGKLNIVDLSPWCRIVDCQGFSHYFLVIDNASYTLEDDSVVHLAIVVMNDIDIVVVL